MSKPLRIALTKGRLEKDTLNLLEKSGFDCTAVRDKGRKLILPIKNANIEVVLAKANDVITYVEHGVCDMGVVGKDTIIEMSGKFFELVDLGFGRCKFALAAKKGTDFYEGYGVKTIATKYPNVARNFFESKGMDIDIVKIEGSVELAPLLELSNGIVDIVETGTTLKENGLEVIEDIVSISARLIVNTVSLKLRQKEIEDLISIIEENLMISKIYANGKDEIEFLENLKKRSGETNKKVEQVVSEIIENVKENGDKAVNDYTLKFDGSLPEYYEVPQDVINDALEEADEDFVNALLNSMENVADFHNRQRENGFMHSKDNGVMLGQRVRGLERVGLYVPGGTAAYPSSVIMNAIPAKIAGVKEIIMVTPPLKDGTPNKDILVAAAVCGVDRIFLTGGAQAVAALAYGTESIPKVDKIVGPGNIYVATAKKLLYGQVDIDMIAGPSEILVMADETADPKFIAADLMSQAEHDKLASSILLTTSEEIADKTIAEIERQMQYLSRKDIIEKSLDDYGMIIICDCPHCAVELANAIAPEHLEVLMKNPTEYIGKLDNAGSVFLGQYASEPLGDYYAGPNHVLPTSGTARFFSPLSVYSFVKRSSYIYYTEEALREAKDDIVLIAEKEGLTAHANAIKVRFE